ncbi:sulfotransferase [Sulfitobacter pseudonitzschiae]|uniref:Sulfotransferase n=1 Tax=Pseudosulfitobacter pseudonitzschiae TaxID=1402135 RepID=A0A9Q2NXW4_9RHOB|nr:sulfotransferase [Pseudosulfitobacter pseudonitzschiae]MBM2294571.1 sulfotransferase [Pseudosulfitobacter pseudonitzschiae]MBM2299538.1 sulfotransferase [Pseudosulfitobacter pseudonitzschiae]MBM2304438.1 sulfotransferase [Pseudosulfitobacter pseudonitzschiae]MBM2314184.1 sulfotransferase [Pseudosulfitobacter pseudonitzschiae]MBM2319099.1 sulfotransferase [Pseudosulfitobacter pseudonitzschiae]
MTDGKIRLDFVVVGAQKAGTTTLHNMLAAHSDIALPALKETHFFSHHDRALRGPHWYADQFGIRESAAIVGEIDPEYLFAPQAATAIETMTTAAKFVIILRHPLDRAYSHFQMSQRRGYETCKFGVALAKEAERIAGNQSEFARDHWSYTARGLYCGQIQRFRAAFPDADFLFLRSDALSQSGYEQVCAFVGTQPISQSSAAKIRSNRASVPRSRMVSNMLYAPEGKSHLRSFVTRAIPQHIKTSLFLWLDRQNQKTAQFDREAAYAEVPKTVLASFADDLPRTEILTGLDLADWRKDIQSRLHK